MSKDYRKEVDVGKMAVKNNTNGIYFVRYVPISFSCVVLLCVTGCFVGLH